MQRYIVAPDREESTRASACAKLNLALIKWYMKATIWFSREGMGVAIYLERRTPEPNPPPCSSLSDSLHENLAKPVRSLSPSPQERLSIGGMAGVAIVSLVFLAFLAYGLVWVTKQVSSVVVIVLVFCVTLLLILCLLGFVLLLSGHLTEKTVEKLFMGLLGKIPDLGIWVQKTRTRKTKS